MIGKEGCVRYVHVGGQYGDWKGGGVRYVHVGGQYVLFLSAQ